MRGMGAEAQAETQVGLYPGSRSRCLTRLLKMPGDRRSLVNDDAD
jgi:hypothetical protein